MLRHDGYRFEAGKRFVRKKSLNKLKDSIRAKTQRCGGVSLEAVIASSEPSPEPNAARLVWVLQAGSSDHFPRS